MEINNQLYQYLVEYRSITRLHTIPSVVRDLDQLLQISLTESALTDYYNLLSVESTLTFNNATNNFRLEYNDPSNQITYSCLDVYEIINGVESQLGQTCNLGASGTILYAITPNNGSVYNAKAGVFLTEYYLINQYEVKFSSFSFGNYGLLLLAFGTIMGGLIFIFNPIIGFIVTPLPLLILSVTNIIDLPSMYGMIGLVIGFMLAIVFRRLA